MALSDTQLRELVAGLMTRPGHEKVRSEIHRMLVDHLGASPGDIDFEKPLPEVHGRLDALLGRTVFEFKSDLRRENEDAKSQLTKYLAERERAIGQSHFGIATDGAEYIAYELRGGKLIQRQRFVPKRGDSHGLALFLSPFLNARPELRPDPQTIAKELGRESIVYEVAEDRLRECWAAVGKDREVDLKRALWAERLQLVYGSEVGSVGLFIQHTYLTIVAKTMATLVLGAEIPAAADLLSGRAFREAGIDGVIESDFFDWVLVAEGSGRLIGEIAAQVARFRLEDIRHDVLKALYESLIDPEQRHDLGEYYTPDWLAERICDEAIERPLEQRVVDPACGSGTFLFHAVRRFLAAAARAGMKPQEALVRCTEKVMGIDVHPVAVINARVTYLLALGENLQDHPALSIPVYLGDSLQWGKGIQVFGGVTITVTPREMLFFPPEVAAHPAAMDVALAGMVRLSDEGAEPAEFTAWLNKQDEPALQGDTTEYRLRNTFELLARLHAEKRNHIWAYVARNLSRPAWLSYTEEQKADVIVGNPPWLSYRFMSKEQQKRLKKECEQRGMWAGGKVATHQDLSAYFFVACMEQYLKTGGRIALVMPLAVLSRKQYAGFIWKRERGERGEVWVAAGRFTAAWDLDQVKPLFKVPSCVLFAEQARTVAEVPETATAFMGQLSRRDASAEEAAAALVEREIPWPRPEVHEQSPYAKQFRQGATVVPRRFFVVEREATGRFGGNPEKPVVVSRTGALDKAPWKSIEPLRGTIEREFLRPLYLGESIAPFRLLEPAEAIIPWTAERGLIDSEGAQGLGYSGVARWLKQAEALWKEYRKSDITLTAQLDYYGKLTAQLPPARLRVLYTASGTLPAAVILRDDQAVVEHKLYWASTAFESEARYLEAVMNSEALRVRVAPKQSRGQWGARDFDKVLVESIPQFEGASPLCIELVDEAERAERVAAAVELPEGIHFTRARQKIREALREDGVAERIDKLVDRLLRG